MSFLDFLYVSNAMFFLLVVIFVSRISKLSIFNPLIYYLFFHGLVFVVRPLFVHFDELNFVYLLYRFYPSEDEREYAVIAENLGLVSFVLACTFAGAHRPFRFNPIASEELRGGGSRGGVAAAAVLLFLAPLFIESSRQIVRVLGSSLVFDAMFQDPTTMYTVFTDTTGYIVEANIAWGTLSVIIVWASRYKKIAFIPLLGFILLRLYIGWNRWAFVMAMASLLLLWLYDRKETWMRFSHVALGVGCLMLFGAISESRDIVRTTLFGETAQQQGDDGIPKRSYFDSLDFANMEFLEYIIYSVPEQSKTYDYFLNTLQVFTEPIPRIIWKDKPIGPPIKTVNFYQFGYPIGMTYSMPGQGWYGFGFTGVAIWCTFTGFLIGRFYGWFVQGTQGRYKIAVYMTVLPLTIQWFRDGILVTALKFPLFPMVAIGLWFMAERFIRGRRRGGDRSGPVPMPRRSPSQVGSAWAGLLPGRRLR